MFYVIVCSNRTFMELKHLFEDRAIQQLLF